jgi:hypothetical protein
MQNATPANISMKNSISRRRFMQAAVAGAVTTSWQSSLALPGKLIAPIKQD